MHQVKLQTLTVSRNENTGPLHPMRLPVNTGGLHRLCFSIAIRGKQTQNTSTSSRSRVFTTQLKHYGAPHCTNAPQIVEQEVASNYSQFLGFSILPYAISILCSMTQIVWRVLELLFASILFIRKLLRALDVIHVSIRMFISSFSRKSQLEVVFT